MIRLELLKQGHLYFDGGMGTLLQARGLLPGQRPEEWNLTHPQIITGLHLDYLKAGCHILKTNTFGVNELRFPGRVEELVCAALDRAEEAIAQLGSTQQPRFIALDLGPCGKLLKPLGDLDFEAAVDLFAQVVRAGQARADLILIETMNDAYETKAAVLAAKENSDLPVFVTNVYDEGGKLMTGADPETMVTLLEGLGVDALGMNCSLGPVQMEALLPRLLDVSSVPVIVNPNAGLPRDVDGKTVYDVGPDEFAACMERMARRGAAILGGCCGTTPDYIRALIEKTADLLPPAPARPETSRVCSYTHCVTLGRDPILIGERINPTGKKRLKQALLSGDIDHILRLAAEQEDRGVQVLDVNVGLPELDEPKVLTQVMEALQEITDLPLELDSSDPAALERAMRRYNGKPLVNSVSGKDESMQAVFPLLRHYGGVAVALLLDEQGIPETAGGRLAIADKILTRAAEYGLGPSDLIFDPLALTISAGGDTANVALDCVRALTARGLRTCMGVSNISFGLPNREQVTAAFFSMALREGLSAAIMNPLSQPMMHVYYAARALLGADARCGDYIAYMQDQKPDRAAPAEAQSLSLAQAVVRGMKGAAAQAAGLALEDHAPMELVQSQIIPALDEVGRGFEEKRLYLPQLLMSAEAASAAFELIQAAIAKTNAQVKKQTIILATVKGDIHDIGKNIVKVLLQNYGYQILDLGRDVAPELVVQTAIDHKVRLVGLSALMTTTVPAMAETIALLREHCPGTAVMVGGAVLTAEYARRIGADYYAKDAMQSVRVAEAYFKEDPNAISGT